jgi:hypothetical protein
MGNKGIGVVFFVAAATIVGCMPGDHCSPGYDCPAPYVPPCTSVERSCDGDTAVTTSSCGSSRLDCTKTGRICSAGACIKPCTADADCSADEYCAKAACTPRLEIGADCTQAPCKAGLVCEASPTTGRKQCAVDCAGADPTAPRCPAGATVACIGMKSYRCDSCGVASIDRDCATAPDAANACVVSNGQAMCVVSTTPDPRCANVDSYCSGDVLVDCFEGYATARASCAPMQCLDNGARCG